MELLISINKILENLTSARICYYNNFNFNLKKLFLIYQPRKQAKMKKNMKAIKIHQMTSAERTYNHFAKIRKWNVTPDSLIDFQGEDMIFAKDEDEKDLELLIWNQHEVNSYLPGKPTETLKVLIQAEPKEVIRYAKALDKNRLLVRFYDRLRYYEQGKN